MSLFTSKGNTKPLSVEDIDALDGECPECGRELLHFNVIELNLVIAHHTGWRFCEGSPVGTKCILSYPNYTGSIDVCTKLLKSKKHLQYAILSDRVEMSSKTGAASMFHDGTTGSIAESLCKLYAKLFIYREGDEVS